MNWKSIFEAGLKFARDGAWVVLVASAAAIAIFSVGFMALTVYAQVMQPALEALWDTGWGPLLAIASSVLFIGGGIFGVFFDMGPTMREGGPCRNRE